MSGHLAIVLPGRGYGPLGPAIRLPRLAVEQSGADVVEIEYPAIPAASDQRAWDSLFLAVSSRIEDALSETSPDQVTFIAKSLGTVVLAAVPVDAPHVAMRAVWLTPIFGQEAVRSGAIAKGWPSLLVAGEADTLHHRDHHETVTAALGGASLVLPRADHMLEVPGDVEATVAGFSALAGAVLHFVRPPG